MSELDLKHWLYQLDLGDKDELIISIKSIAESGCFFYGDSGQLGHMAERHRRTNGSSNLEFHEHEVGPEWLFVLMLADGGLGVAEASLGTVKSITDMVAFAVKTDWDGRRAHCDPPESLFVVVWGLDPMGVYAESPDHEINLYGDAPDVVEKAGDIVACMIKSIAEVRRLADEDDAEDDGDEEAGEGRGEEGQE